MTPVLPEEESSAVKMKQRLISNVPAKEETRTLLNFSRENLNISHSDLEQGFKRSRLRLNRIMCVAVLIISVLCLGVTSWYLSCSLLNKREIEQLKRNFESLKHQLLQRDLMDELKAFEEQLYAEESSEDNDPDEADIDNADYDSNYDDDGSATHDYSGDYHPPLTYNSSSELTEITSPMPISTHFDSNKTISELLSTLRKVEAKRGDEFEKNVRENHKNNEREHLKKEHKTQSSHEISGANSKKYKRDIVEDAASTNNIKENIKSKRSVSDRTMADDLSTDTSNYQNGRRRHKIPGYRSRASGESYRNDNSRRNSTPHPPKKYHAHAHPETALSVHDDQLSGEINQPDRHDTSKSTEILSERVNWRNARHDTAGNRTGIRRPIHVYAIHYGANSALFSAEDEHTGNGRARHNNGIFKAWQPSNWVADLGMNNHFTLAADGKLTVREPGLYLVYAQIHYLDQHDENGFHILVNGSPILQCMVYSPGVGHKSRSCFSAQVTLLHADDHLVLKDVASARYTLFQRDKSFFGLVKLGELKNQQRH
ncbi:uncharacterized protein [Linepithema humile]|uniref:uncharacterized protein n=1 Tax=Linepithema humile TaxID=83485 RepID=UPI000623B2E0|nr:PREDICTED: uncharacterized protein LOC105673825 [Linepithema humile]XP_012225182.1 PREDICTED: uncharacterized protein LOC105673825 [Linepithema humile]XP_012225183.1 PREDICTED: uncharacterized protein LOC105673825 [Linepithema humile]XP_012225184.1 PREDICTED: uncharacterized protein LOC105673825 [Linepithema humile]XP_012225185.1 PREDICTED: uncharacterized protein LOC105673825 [Linepithema humile]XP_012225186.1 PREDICTED: uncharacterized protein LOC105673825 [Linepithema humile]